MTTRRADPAAGAAGAAGGPSTAASPRAGSLRLGVVALVGAAGPAARALVDPGGDPHLGAVLAWVALATALACAAASRRSSAGAIMGALGVAAGLAAAASEEVLTPVVAVVATTALAFGALVCWPIVRRATEPASAARIAGLALGPLLVAQLRWARDPSPRLHLGLLVLAGGLLEWYARRPAAAQAVDDRIARGAAAAARALRRAVLWTMGAVVLVPLRLLDRAVGATPLDPGWTTPSSAWVGVDPRRHHEPDGTAARPRSMGSRELRPAPSQRRRQAARATLGIVALAGMVALAVRPDLSWPSWPGRDAEPRAERDAFDRPFEDQEAFADAPWAADLRVDLLEAWNGLEFNGASGGWQIRDVRSDFVNVRDGERATIAPAPSDEDPITIWLLGGSAAFGAGQRDEHTIASELVRLGDAEGRPLEVRNLAVPATVNWQTAVLLATELRWGPPPDLIVIYDGANDVALQAELTARGKGGSDRPASLIDAQIDEVLRERADATDAPGGSLRPEPTDPEPAPTPAEAGEHIVTRYLRGVELARQVAADAGVPVVVAWQPDLRAKRPYSAADREVLEELGVDDASIADWQATTDVVRRRLPAADVIDLSAAFDGTDDAVYWDTVHTNELGARLAAAALHDAITPELDALAAAG